MKSLIVAIVATLGVLAGTVSTASAGDCCYRKVVCYKTVTVCEVRQVPYTAHVTEYDECGCPHVVCVTRYRNVQVEVKKVVPVVKYVPICD